MLETLAGILLVFFSVLAASTLGLVITLMFDLRKK